MADSSKNKGTDMLAFIKTVHSNEQGSQQDQAIERALHTLEATHRKAALAMRNFERLSKTEPAIDAAVESLMAGYTAHSELKGKGLQTTQPAQADSIPHQATSAALKVATPGPERQRDPEPPSARPRKTRPIGESARPAGPYQKKALTPAAIIVVCGWGTDIVAHQRADLKIAGSLSDIEL